MFILTFLLGSLYAIYSANGFDDNDLFGISHVGMTVKNLNLSTIYYTEILGGMLVEELSTGNNGIFGDSHYYRIFQKEILDGQRVPDISTMGSHKVCWNIILLPNILIMLMEFSDRNTGEVYYDQDLRIGNAFIASSHGAFAASTGIVPLQQVRDIIKQQDAIEEMEASKKGFISFFGKTPSTFEERNKQVLQNTVLQYSNGFSLSSFRGPVGEKWELLFREGSGLVIDLAPFCQNKGVFQTLLDVPRASAYKTTLSHHIAGIHHINAVVDDTDKAVQFYTDILGGKLNKRKSASRYPIDKSFYDLIHQDEILQAKTLNLSADINFGILPENFAKESIPLLDIFFITFDNTYFEPYRYYINKTFSGIPSVWYRNWSSPAYVNIMHTGFWVKDSVKMSTFIKSVEKKSALRGFYKVKANRAVAVNTLGQEVDDDQYSDPFPDNHRLAGFDYVFFKGPSGEQLVATQFTGKAKAALQAAMELYGAVSTAFDTTNPWKWDGFNKTCQWISPNAATSINICSFLFLSIFLVCW